MERSWAPARHGWPWLASTADALFGPPPGVEPVHVARARSVSQALLVLLVLAVPAAVLLPWAYPLLLGVDPVRMTAVLVGVPVAFMLAYGLSRTRFTLPAAAFACAAAAVGTVVAASANPALAAPASVFLMLAAVLLLASLVLPFPQAAGLGLLNVVGVVAVQDWFPVLGPHALEVPYLFLGANALAFLVYGSMRNVDLQRLHVEVRRREEAEVRQGLLVSQLPVGTLMVRGGQVVSANPAAETLFGCRAAGSLEGLRLDRLLDGDHSALEAMRRGPCAGAAAPAAFDGAAVQENGRRIPVHVVPTAVPGNGETWAVLLLDRSTEQRAQEQSRQAASLRQRQLYLTQLLSTASHEINGPLTPIRLQSNLLRREADEKGLSLRSLQILDRNVERLALLVEDFLDVARLENGVLALRRRRCNAVALVREAVETYGLEAHRLGVRLRLETPEPVFFNVDPLRMSQVLYNLVANGVRFTPEGGTVTISVTTEDGEAVVRVRDEGPGLTQEQQDLLFRPFQPVLQPPRGRDAGTGLGLFICRGIVEQHGGRIWCQSDGPGTGSTFAFAIPARAPGGSPPGA